MAALEPIAEWPPGPITTERLLLREPEAGDRSSIIELFSSPEVGTHIGGARSREELEASMPETPRRRPGLFVIEAGGGVIGTVTLDRRDPDRIGHIRPEARELELGYLLLPNAWGNGYATEACSAVVDWCAGALPGESIVLSTQTANAASMRVAEKLGFSEVERFEDYGAQQWFGVRPAASLTPSPARSDPVAEAFSALVAEGIRRCEIDRGGRKVRWLETGAGETTVVLEAGAMSPVASFAAVFRDLAPDYRVVAYDRGGYGSSDFAPLSVDLQLGDLLAVLEAAGSGRNILVGHSWGGLLVQLAAWQRPETIAGMVLVDPAHERYWLEFVTDDERSEMRRRPEPGDSIDGSAGAEMRADAVELTRDIVRSVGGGQHLQDLVQAACESYLATDDQLFVHLDEFPMIVSAAESVAERRSAGIWPDVQVIVLTETNGRPEYWTNAVTTVQDELVADVGGRQVIVPDSGHYIQVDRPDLVSAAVRDVAGGDV